MKISTATTWTEGQRFWGNGSAGSATVGMGPQQEASLVSWSRGQRKAHSSSEELSGRHWFQGVSTWQAWVKGGEVSLTCRQASYQISLRR